MTPKIVEIFYTPYQARNAILLKEYGEIVRVALNEETSRALSERKIDHISIDEFIDSNTFLGLDSSAITLARTWYENEGLQSLITYKGYNLVEFVQWDMSYFFSLVLESLEIATSLVEKMKLTKNDQIIMYDDWDGCTRDILTTGWEDIPIKAMIEVARTSGIPIKIIKLKREVECKQDDSLTATLRSLLLSSASKVLNRLGSLHGSKKEKVHFQPGWSQAKRIIKHIRDARFYFDDENYYGLWKQIFGRDFFNVFRYDLRFGCLLHRQPKGNHEKFAEFLTRIQEGVKNFEKFNTPSIRYKDEDLWPLIKTRINFLFQEVFPKTLEKIEITEDFLRSEEIRLIVVPSDVNYETKILVTVGKRLGVKSLVLQHGMLGHPISSLPLSADKIAAYGKITKDWFLSQGVEENRIVITGSPRFDKYYTKTDPDLKKIREKLGLEHAKKTVTLLLQHNNIPTHFANVHLRECEFKSLCKMVVEAIEEIPWAQLLIKLHPGDGKAGLHKKIIKELSRKPILIVQHFDLFKILHVSDLVITYSSTAALEAMILGKPVVAVAFKGKPNSIFVNSIIPPVKNKEEVTQAAKRLLRKNGIQRQYEEYRKKFLFSALYKQDGKASWRVASLMKKTMNEPMAKHYRRWCPASSL